MLEGRVKGFLNLFAIGRIGIIGKSMILSSLEGKFRLQKELFTGN